MECACIEERLLHGVQLTAFFESLNGRYRQRCSDTNGKLARSAGCITEQHGTGAALSLATPILRAGKPQFVAQNGQQRSVRRIAHSMALAVYRDFDWIGHVSLKATGWTLLVYAYRDRGRNGIQAKPRLQSWLRLEGTARLQMPQRP